MANVSTAVRDFLGELAAASGAEVTVESTVVGEYIGVNHARRPDETLCLFSLPRDDVHEIPTISDDTVEDVYVHLISSRQDEITVAAAVTLPSAQFARIAASWASGACPASLAEIATPHLTWTRSGRGELDAASSRGYPALDVARR